MLPKTVHSEEFLAFFRAFSEGLLWWPDLDLAGSSRMDKNEIEIYYTIYIMLKAPDHIVPCCLHYWSLAQCK